MNTVIVGTRGSKLALSQTQMVIDSLKKANKDINFKIKIINTKGDTHRASISNLVKTGDKGFWIKEIQDALLNKEIDIAVHSLKDLPTSSTNLLSINAIPKRFDPRDALISKYKMKNLPKNAKIGTSSVRRAAFLKFLRPDLEIIPIRGNIDSRIKLMKKENLDGIILATAGLLRTNNEELISEKIDSEIMLPAPAQGALALETLTERDDIAKIVYKINHQESDDQITAERSFLEHLNGGCTAPIGALATIKNDILTLDGWIADIQGKKVIKAQITGDKSECFELGEDLAKDLLDKGANELINKFKC